MLTALLTFGLTGCGDEVAAPAPSAPAAGRSTTTPAASASPSVAVPSVAVPTPRPSATPSPSPTPTAGPSTSTSTEVPSGDSYVLTAAVDQVDVYASPDGQVVQELDNPRQTGAPLTFLLADDPGRGWYEVLVPVRPNGTTGFVRAQDVTVAAVPYRLVMSTEDNELTVYEDGEVLRTMPAASGTGDTPTPLGLFYLTELLEPTNVGYGPYAYGLSAFSEVLTSFGGGPGQIGLHGTDDADSVGRAVSHGCIRLSDEDITYLAGLLPLGTPVEIR